MGPHPPKPKVLLWADVSYMDMEEIDNTKSTLELKRVLCEVLGIQMSQQPMASILSDLYFHALIFSRVKRFSREQTSVLLSIMKAIHATNVETPLNNMDQCFTNCSELLLCHSSKRPPFSIDLFNSEQMTQILQYLVDTYFRHFLLYKYIFTAKAQLNLSLSYSEIPGAIPSASSGAS